MPLEKLDLPLMAPGLFHGLKRAEVAAFSGLWIPFA